jgi:hypothetical protein
VRPPTQENRALGEEAGGTSTRAVWLAWSVCGLTLALTACAVAFAFLNRGGLWESVRLLALVSSALVGGVVASRRPVNPVGWFLLISAACLVVVVCTEQYATYGLLTEPGSLPLARAMAWSPQWIWVPGVVLILVFLPLYFPDGRLVSHRWRWVVTFAAFFSVFHAVFSAFQPGDVQDLGLLNPLGVEAFGSLPWVIDAAILPLWLALLFVSAASLVVRFRRSGAEQRQQIKWLTFAASAIPVWFLVSPLVQETVPVLFEIGETLAFAGVPVAVGIAVLKYRLYAIDVLINRTLVYGTLSMVLALVYLGGIVSLQRVFVVLTGQESQLAVVASTLAIAALFNPLRRRIQALIDRRFYRRKYDARKTLEAFGARLRAETDLDALKVELVAVVRETLQPAHVSVWLRPAPERGRGEEPGDPHSEAVPGSR